MKKLFFLAIFLLVLLTTPSVVSAQSMMDSTGSPQVGNQFSANPDDHTAREEAEGKEIWEKLQSQQLECQNLTDENYGSLGEYFMGQMMGDSHTAMNNRLIQMMGEKGEEQMHIAMGKRMSACEPNAPMPQNMPALSGVEGMGGGMMSMMMNMMDSAGSPQVGGGGNMMGYGGLNNMMGGWGGFGLGWVFMILFWGVLILAIIALLKWLLSGDKGQSDKTPLEILQERFAKGEIDKKEYEEKAKILSKSR